jgi:tetratricopeptide (TPR) repeat protein
MKISNIVHLESYRCRKDNRLRQTMALYGHDPERSGILLQIWRAASLVGADRGAVIWLDEYGPGLAHPFALLDLASDRPRRLFSPIPLRAAWDAGVPGLLDMANAPGQLGRESEGIKSVSAVALGSDGPRSWFLCLDSLTPRPALSEEAAGELMFIAGECASILLHRDLDREITVRAPFGGEVSIPGEVGEPFAGWHVLQDIEERRGDQEASALISTRFLVARVIRGLVEDEFVVDPDSLGYQVKGVRKELESHQGREPEHKVWERVLAAIELLDHDELLAAVLEWGGIVEGMGHFSGALELHSLAYDLAVAVGSGEAAVDAARFRGRVFRKTARWDDAIRWYGVAETVARESQSSRKLAPVLDGLASAHRDRGNLPKARELLGQLLTLGVQDESLYAQALAHHSLMTVEKEADNLEEAVLHGWKAFHSHDSRKSQLYTLFDLAGVLRKKNELAAAWDAYSVVAAQVGTFEYVLLSLDAMALIAAQRGQGARYDTLRARVDGMGWDEQGASAVVQGQVLLYRGISCRALGRTQEGDAWITRALSFAEEHGLNKLIFDAEAALQPRESGEISESWAPQEESGQATSADVQEVHQSLQEMREALVGAGSAL